MTSAAVPTSATPIHAARSALVERAYAEAVRFEYRWHEFGDVHLIVP